MEWFWEVLGIEATKDIGKIKKAYVSEVRRFKNKETKEEVSQAVYDQLALAEKQAIAFIEEQGPQQIFEHRTRDVDEQIETTVESVQRVVKPAKQSEPLIEKESSVELKKEVPVHVEKPVEEAALAKKSEPKDTATDVQQRWVKAKEAAKQRNQGRQQRHEKQETTKLTSKKEAVIKGEKPQAKEKSNAPSVNQLTAKAAVPSRVLADLHKLLAEWPRKIIMKEWESCFRYRRQWSNDEFVEIRENFLPVLKGQLVYLPKKVLWYLYDELDLATYELTSEFNWFMAIDVLPDFSFDQALYLPEEEAADYFDRRLQLYQVIGQADWHSRTFEIDGLLAYFYATDGWQADHQIADQDVENLAAIYQIKRGLEKLVQNNEPNRAIADHLLPPNTPLNQVENQTAKFLRIIFTSLKEKKISLEDGLFIENPQTNYLEDNLRELLVGLVFYRAKDQVKATKHFSNLTNDYQGLVKGLQNSAGFKGATVKPVYAGTTTYPKPVDWRTILRIVVIGVIGLSILGSFFSNDDDRDYADDSEYYDDESDYEDDWLDTEDPGYAFLAYFIEETDYEDDIESQREMYVETWVSPEATDVFNEHIYDVDPDETYEYDIIYKQIDDNIAYYLITRDEEPYLLVELTDWEWVTAVVGEGWQETDVKTFEELTNKMKFTVEEIVENVIVGYFLLPVDEREDEFYYVMDYLTDQAYNRLEWDLSIVEELDFEKGTYQTSQTLEGQAAILVNDSEDELCLVLLLDSYGRVDEVVELFYDDYAAKELTALKEQADEKKSLPKLDAVSL
ncbi:hypothetical protein I6N95_13150 [Vagococcus sp. BWB3-3]|uniref:Uncharacterized protein n=1 Tax=Vagococcus allomyrinae TaxID=2794353 RepID=A0A940PED2_9ENTE|nr:hypothetical protein [Vagococcus allomyrinae]MBP1041961.1 hypothetical protein [Vagococcus allomyrinae]